MIAWSAWSRIPRPPRPRRPPLPRRPRSRALPAAASGAGGAWAHRRERLVAARSLRELSRDARRLARSPRCVDAVAGRRWRSRTILRREHVSDLMCRDSCVPGARRAAQAGRRARNLALAHGSSVAVCVLCAACASARRMLCVRAAGRVWHFFGPGVPVQQASTPAAHSRVEALRCASRYACWRARGDPASRIRERSGQQVQFGVRFEH
jgi:hypothetical protein